jgi:CRISPR-associated protein Csx10
VLTREVPDAPPFELLPRCFTQTRVVSGWNSAYQLPKDDEVAITKGAAFLYRTETDMDILLAWLRQVEEQGIGERRAEGFGQVIVCHPFHWEVPKR